MDFVFISYSIVVLKIFYIFIEVSSASTEIETTELPNEENSTEILNGPNDDNSAEYANVDGSIVKLQGPNDKNSTEILNGPDDKNSTEILNGPDDKNSTEILNGPDDKNSTEYVNEENAGGSIVKLQGPNGEPQNGTNVDDSIVILQGNDPENLTESQNGNTKHFKEYIGTNKTDYVEFDSPDNDTVIAKLMEDKTAEEPEQDNSSAKEKLYEADEPKNVKGQTKMAGVSYLDIDQSKLDFSGPSDYEEDNTNDEVSKQEEQRYQEELKRGNKAESYGSNTHDYQPDTYPELNRRFIPNYPYKDEHIILVNQEAKQINLEPKLATPDLVLAVAKESAILEAARPRNPSEYLIEKSSLRNGNYWNALWKEDVKPTVLRSSRKKPLGVITAKINPGSNLYDLVTKLKQISPRLLYVINKKVKY